MVLRRARSILGSESDSEEVLQEVFLALVDRPQQFKGRSAATTYLYTMTTHNCLNRIRNHRKRGAILAGRGAPVSVAPAVASDRSVAKSLLAKMPPKLATVAIHYCIDEMTQDEIALVMGCSRRMVGKYIAKLKEFGESDLGSLSVNAKDVNHV